MVLKFILTRLTSSPCSSSTSTPSSLLNQMLSQNGGLNDHPLYPPSLQQQQQQLQLLQQQQHHLQRSLAICRNGPQFQYILGANTR